ncbi:MAG: hypothetical protein WKF73_14990 [Nocardioidaceae bacterium]
MTVGMATFGGLELLILGPLLGALMLPVLSRDPRRVIQLAIALATAMVALSIWVWVDVVAADGDYVWRSDALWISALGVRWQLGVDDVSAPLVVLTAILTWCCLVSLLKRAPHCGGTAALVALILVIEAGSIGTFAALDLIVFFVFFEVVLIPMWFVIAQWGNRHDEVGRRQAASRFLVVTVIGLSGDARRVLGIAIAGRDLRPRVADRARCCARRSHPSARSRSALGGLRGQNSAMAAAFLASGCAQRSTHRRLRSARGRAAQARHLRSAQVLV